MERFYILTSVRPYIGKERTPYTLVNNGDDKDEPKIKVLPGNKKAL